MMSILICVQCKKITCSANILEIPLSNDTEKVPSKVVNSQCTEGNGASPNNKNKTIVRKNNIVMEVT